MVDVRKMASRRERKKHRSGILSGALTSSSSEEQPDLTYKVETMGCQMNIADSERMEGQLQSLGIRPLSEQEEEQKKHPDLVLLNTCSIRDHAEQKVYS